MYGSNQHTKFVVCFLCRQHANNQLEVELLSHLEQAQDQVLRRRQQRARRRKERKQRLLRRKPLKKPRGRIGEASPPGPVVTHCNSPSRSPPKERTVKLQKAATVACTLGNGAGRKRSLEAPDAPPVPRKLLTGEAQRTYLCRSMQNDHVKDQEHHAWCEEATCNDQIEQEEQAEVEKLFALLALTGGGSPGLSLVGYQPRLAL